MKYFFLLLTFISFGQQTQNVDFKTASGYIFINPIERSFTGNASYEFTVLAAIDTIRMDAIHMRFASVKINNRLVKYVNNEKELLLFDGFKMGKNKLSFEFAGTPKQTMYFNGDFSCVTCTNQQVWTQGQGKYTSHWFPSFDDVNEKMVFSLAIAFDKRFTVISNGELKKINDNVLQNNSAEIQTWHYEMEKPMSSYLLMLAIGKFEKQTLKSISGVPLEFYYQRKDQNKVPFTYYKSKEIFDFMEKEIGVKYPWKIYRQIPVEDFLYAGMENTTSTIFAQEFMVDAVGFNDRNYINVNAHELAHQWFGDLITATSGEHHWLQEGFATYYALLAEREIFGEDYFYNKLYQSALELKNAGNRDTIPVMNEKASSLSFYQKGAWALHVIRESIGEKAFQLAVKNYLVKYQYKTVVTDDFLAEIKLVSNFDTEKFKNVWLKDYQFQVYEAEELLKKNKFIVSLYELKALRNKAFSEKKGQLITILKSASYFPLKTEVLYQIRDISFAEKEELLQIAMKTNELEVRKAVASFMNEIPLSFKFDYETLLDDDSYKTKEIAFVNLWNNFVFSREVYLEKIKKLGDKANYELRLLYLKYSILGYDPQLKNSEKYFENQRNITELVAFTNSKYERTIRQNAIENAFLLNLKDPMIIRNLVNATTHHNWQFVKYAKDTIRILLHQDVYKNLFQEMLPKLEENEKMQLQKLLTE